MKKFLSVLMAFAMVFALAGCASEPSPEDAVKTAIESLKDFDSETAIPAWGGNLSEENLDESEEAVKEIYSRIAYEIISSEVNDDTAIVTAKISNIDISSITTDAVAELFIELFSQIGTDTAMTDEETQQFFTDLFVEKIKSGEYDRVEKTVDITLTKIGGEWVIDDGNDAAIDALTGGMLSAADEIAASFS